MASANPAKPLVLVPACNVQRGGHAAYLVGRKYVEAVRLAGGLPLVVPRLEPGEVDGLLDRVDGVFLTGSPSNVHPSHFGEAVHDTSLPLDPERDAWVLPLIPKVLARGMPLLAVCRGAQETNVALGGSLHQAVQQVTGYGDHRDDPQAPAAVQYGPAHQVQVLPGGVLESITGGQPFAVNSLHGQGVQRLADGLRVEAVAPDGLVEAFSVDGAAGFSLCVQWHPEWQAADNPQSVQMLAAFGAALRAYQVRR